MQGEVFHLTRQAHVAVEVFSKPSEFSSPREFLAAITEVMHNLCEIKGVKPEPIPDEWVQS